MEYVGVFIFIVALFGVNALYTRWSKWRFEREAESYIEYWKELKEEER
jgi:hypothetical protein